MNKLLNDQNLNLLSDCLFYHRIKGTYVERYDGKVFTPKTLFNMAMNFVDYKAVWEWMNDSSTQETNDFTVKGEINAVAELERIVTINLALKEQPTHKREKTAKKLLEDIREYAKGDDLVTDYVEWLCGGEMSYQLNNYLENSLYYERVSG